MARNRVTQVLDFATLVSEAQGLKSEHGENTEYDRALVELVTFARGGSSDDLRQVAVELGIDPDAVYPGTLTRAGGDA